RRITLAILFVGISIVHHHVPIVATVVLGVVALRGLIGGQRKLLYRIAASLGLAFVIGSPYFLTYLVEIPIVKNSGTLTYYEPALLPGAILANFGRIEFYGLIGGAFGYLVLSRLVRDRRLPVTGPILNWSIIGMLSLFVLLDWGVRYAMFWLRGTEA